MVPVGMSGCMRGRCGGAKFAQFRDFDGVAGTPDVKTFRPRCTAVPGAAAASGAGMRTRAARWLHRAGVFIAWLFSSTFLRMPASAVTMRVRVSPRLAVVERGRGHGRGGMPEGAGCEIFSRGLLTVKKTVIRFRLSRPCLPNRVRRINRPMRSSPFKTTATLMTVDMAPLPPEKRKRLSFPMSAPSILAGIAVSVTARLTRRRSPHAASAGLIQLGVSTPYH